MIAQHGQRSWEVAKLASEQRAAVLVEHREVYEAIKEELASVLKAGPKVGDKVTMVGYVRCVMLNEEGWAPEADDAAAGLERWAALLLHGETQLLVQLSSQPDRDVEPNEFRVLHPDSQRSRDELAQLMAVVAILRDAEMAGARVRISAVIDELRYFKAGVPVSSGLVNVIKRVELLAGE